MMENSIRKFRVQKEKEGGNETAEHRLIHLRKKNKNSKKNSYHLSILGVLVGIGWTSDVIPHLTRCHCKDDALAQSKGNKKKKQKTETGS